MAGDDPAQARRQAAALLLSNLLTTPESGLEAFRTRHPVTVADLRRARDLLDTIYEAIVTGDEQRWRGIARASDYVRMDMTGPPTAAAVPFTATEPLMLAPDDTETVAALEDTSPVWPSQSQSHSHSQSLDATALSAGSTLTRELGVEQYASLLAELATCPASGREVVLKRYTVAGEAELRSLDQSWSERFRRDPEVHATFQRAFESYRAWLAGRGSTHSVR
jgi:hypothetical protein